MHAQEVAPTCARIDAVVRATSGLLEPAMITSTGARSEPRLREHVNERLNL